MEIAMTEKEKERILASHPENAYLVFPEDRLRPIRRDDVLPKCWAKGPSRQFRGEARPGEFYAFQIGVYAAREALGDLAVAFSDLRTTAGAVIPASSMRCFNLEGADWLGRKFRKSVPVPRGKVQALWIGVQVPDNASGLYEGMLALRPKGAKETGVQILLSVAGDLLEDAGDGEIWRHSRLRWLDSTRAVDDEVTAPFTPLQVRGRAIRCLGRRVVLADTGLPDRIESYFTREMTAIGRKARDILASPISLTVRTARGTLDWSGGEPKVLYQAPGAAEWESRSWAKGLLLDCQARMEFDGHIAYRLSLRALEKCAIRDIRLEIPFRRDVAVFVMGMGREGGYRPASMEWKWDPKRSQDCLWIGDVNAGLRCRLRGSNYERPNVNIYYSKKPLNVPEAWDNGGKGGCRVSETQDGPALFEAFSGPRALEPGEELRFDFDLLITPFRPIVPAKRFAMRYYHNGGPNVGEYLEAALAGGANIVNVHHGNDINPWINYPFLTADEMRALVRQGHEKGLRVKIYYTVRELTNHLPELWALRSLGDEVIARGKGEGVPGQGGTDDWLVQHLRKDYIPAWKHVFQSGKLKGQVDASLLTTPMSRWHNYYVEGLSWLLRNIEIDGIYVDDTAYDRTIMRRARKVLDRERAGSLIDLHSWNHFNDWAGWANCANLYMEILPYVDSIWFGEGFDYNKSPDYWMVEICGIPYGIMGEMLEGGGNPWRGMIYGMTGRLPWSGNPAPVWEFWDAFGIDAAEMIGYWADSCPVKTDHAKVLATVYRKKGKSLVSIASWAAEPVECNLKINWRKLGLSRRNTRIHAPRIAGFQDEADFSPDQPIPIAPGRGWLLVLED
jgi:hypothetical protein